MKKIYFVLTHLLADNLGVNSICGFMESFSADYFCRFCRGHKSETKTLCIEKNELLRTVENYLEDAESCSFGVKESCVFNCINSLHCVLNSTADEMHDIRLGIARYSMTRIINRCIKNIFFT